MNELITSTTRTTIMMMMMRKTRSKNVCNIHTHSIHSCFFIMKYFSQSIYLSTRKWIIMKSKIQKICNMEKSFDHHHWSANQYSSSSKEWIQFIWWCCLINWIYSQRKILDCLGTIWLLFSLFDYDWAILSFSLSRWSNWQLSMTIDNNNRVFLFDI